MNKSSSQNKEDGDDLASFPGRSRLQFLIACSIQKRGLGEGVTCVTSGRHEGRCEGAVPDCCSSQSLHWSVYQTTSCTDASFRMLQSQVLGQDIIRRTLRFFVGHGPPSRLPSHLPDITHVTLSPTPSPSVFIALFPGRSRLQFLIACKLFLYCKRSKTLLPRFECAS